MFSVPVDTREGQVRPNTGPGAGWCVWVGGGGGGGGGGGINMMLIYTICNT